MIMDRIVEDEMLVAQFQAGRPDAFDDLMKRYKGRIYAYLLRSVKNYEDAEELTIEVFFKAYRALDTWKPQARFSTWLYRIAHNLSIDFHRAKSRRQTYSLDDEELSIDEPTAVDLWSNPEWEIEEKDRHRVIREAIDQLSPKQKAVFILNRYQGLQIKEITEVLGMAEGTVKIHLHRAVKKLQTLLLPLWDGNEI
ncbi:RNA polymerase subunit sigma-24 [Candidatus Poribacteria bacterium]|nr:MAG: RNA polymerase subunit sigma-24 [Candidatus Poribacteria bacterium]